MAVPTFAVVIHQDAVDDLRKAYKFVSKNAPKTVAKWYERLEMHVKTLDKIPSVVQSHANLNVFFLKSVNFISVGALTYFEFSSPSMTQPSAF